MYYHFSILFNGETWLITDRFLEKIAGLAEEQILGSFRLLVIFRPMH